MTTYTTLSDTTLQQDKPVTQSVARAWRDNPLGIQEGDATAPKIAHKAIKSGAFFVTAGSSSVSVSSGNRIPYNSEVFDMEGWFDAATNYRYTPQVEGLYQISAYVPQGTSGTATGCIAQIRKNGSVIGPKCDIGAANTPNTPITILMYMNGSTDYLDVVVSYSGGTYYTGGGNGTTFSGCLIAHKA